MGHTQTDYSDRMDPYSVGQLITSTSHDVDGREVKHTGGIAFGRAVGAHRGTSRATDDPQAVRAGVSGVGGAHTATAATGNTGNGTISAVAIHGFARTGNYRVAFTAATAFTLFTPDGIPLGSRTSAGQIVTPQISVTFTAGGTAMAGGDEISLAVRRYGGIADFVGITLKDKTRSPLDNDTYKNGAIASVLVRGDVAVRVEHFVNVGEPAGFDADGRLGSVTADDNHRIPGARFQTRALASEIAIVRLAGPPGGVGAI